MSTISTITALTVAAFMVSGCALPRSYLLWAGGDGQWGTVQRDIDECVQAMNSAGRLRTPGYAVYSEGLGESVKYVCPPPSWWCPIWRSGRAPGPTAWHQMLMFDIMRHGYWPRDAYLPYFFEMASIKEIVLPSYRRCMEGKGYYEPDEQHRYFHR